MRLDTALSASGSALIAFDRAHERPYALALSACTSPSSPIFGRDPGLGQEGLRKRTRQPWSILVTLGDKSKLQGRRSESQDSHWCFHLSRCRNPT